MPPNDRNPSQVAREFRVRKLENRNESKPKATIKRLYKKQYKSGSEKPEHDRTSRVRVNQTQINRNLFSNVTPLAQKLPNYPSSHVRDMLYLDFLYSNVYTQPPVRIKIYFSFRIKKRF